MCCHGLHKVCLSFTHDLFFRLALALNIIEMPESASVADSLDNFIQTKCHIVLNIMLYLC